MQRLWPAMAPLPVRHVALAIVLSAGAAAAELPPELPPPPPEPEPSGPAPAVRADPSGATPTPTRGAPGLERAMTFDAGPTRATLEAREWVLDGARPRQRWLPVCESPCETEVQEGAEYRVAGIGVHRSRAFVVPRGQGTLRLHADVGAKGPWVTGVVLTSVGGGIALFTATMCMLTGCARMEDGRDVGIAVAAGTGAVMAVVGVVLMATNRTKVTLASSSGPTARALLPRGLAVSPAGFVF